MERLDQQDWDGKTHRLSFCGRIVLFQCRRSSGHREKPIKTSELVFSSLSFKGEDNSFQTANSGVAAISDVDIVTCKCAFNVQKRVNTPCVLLMKRISGKRFRYSLFILSSINRLELHVEFELQYRMREKVFILDGPTVLWSHAETVFYTSLHLGEVRQIPIHFSQSVIGELPILEGRLFILGLQNSSNECPKDKPSSADRYQTLGYFIENGQMFDSTLVLPSAYTSITQCILVLSAEKVDSVLNSSVVAATCKQQLVYFENGIPRDVCQLPFDGPTDIQLVNTGRHGCLFAISFDQGHVCAIWQETFQVASCWSGVSSVHVDDFLGNGTDQLLLVFEDQGQTGQPLDNFLITDLCGTTHSGQGSGDAETFHLAEENYILTLQALESRLQSGMSMLQELQRDVRVKERVLHQSVQVLTDMVSGREPVLTQSEQEGLVALWDGDDEPKDELLDDKMQGMPAVTTKPQVDKMWHRVIEDRLVVGVLLTTDGSIPVEAVGLCVLTETGQRSPPAVIQTHSQVFWLGTPGPSSPSSPSTQPEPAAKRSKQDNADGPSDAHTCRLAVTAVTKLTPLLNSGCVKCPVMLHYVQRQESSAPVNNTTSFVFHCGQVSVDIRSKFQPQLVKNTNLKTAEAQEDFLSLLSVLDQWVFHVDSPDHSLGDVDGWIQRTAGCERLEVNPQYLLFNSAGPSALMLLHWHQTTPFQGELSVHSSQLQMVQLMDSLRNYLPASCSIRPVKETGIPGTARMFSLALEKEVISLKEGLSDLLCGEREDGETGRNAGVKNPETPKPGSAEGLQTYREEWHRDLEWSRMRLSPLVDLARYRRLTQSLSEVQLVGDMVAVLQTQRACSSGPH
ncbi:Fanconi anemia group B protein isoform X2 [Lampris incognitus]|uniref:Fanconi anemia group B protein isoform X2 n=1 Tax=Lampris incognitus TaxID=2546036 RepID=UPI0024B61030|nr:Fanconi anemia group B protein isoform X2 [Lampris incognitus]